MKNYVGAVLVDFGKRIYLIKEDDINGIGQNRWNLPGGSVEENEGLVEAVIRETVEETGYTVKAKSLLGCYKSKKDDKSWLYIVFEMEPMSDDAGAVDSAVKDGKWFDAEEFLNMDVKELVHEDMKLVYQKAISGKGMSLETVKYINY